MKKYFRETTEEEMINATWFDHIMFGIRFFILTLICMGILSGVVYLFMVLFL